MLLILILIFDSFSLDLAAVRHVLSHVPIVIDVTGLISLFVISMIRGGRHGFRLVALLCAGLRWYGHIPSSTFILVMATYDSLINHIIEYFAGNNQYDDPLLPFYICATEKQMTKPKNAQYGSESLGFGKHWCIWIEHPGQPDVTLLHYRNPTEEEVTKGVPLDPSFRLKPSLNQVNPLELPGLIQAYPKHLRQFVGYVRKSTLTRMLKNTETVEAFVMDVSGRCQDWCYKMAYTISASPTLTYALMVLKDRWFYPGFIVAALIDGGWYSADWFPRALFVYTGIYVMLLYDFYEITNPAVARARNLALDKNNILAHPNRHGFLAHPFVYTLHAICWLIAAFGYIHMYAWCFHHYPKYSLLVYETFNLIVFIIMCISAYIILKRSTLR